MQVAVVENGVPQLRKIAVTADYGAEIDVNARSWDSRAPENIHYQGQFGKHILT